jgi:hypothetical protein
MTAMRPQDDEPSRQRPGEEPRGARRRR